MSTHAAARWTANNAHKNAMKRTLLLLALVAAFGGGCRAVLHLQQSAFLARFVLDRSVKATAYKGIGVTSGPGGSSGMTGATGGVGTGRRDVKSSVTTTAGFTINEEGENSFNEGEFIEALASQIKKEIEESRAIIIASGSPASNEFHVDYKDGEIKGRIIVSGSRSGQSYVVKANIDESNKP